MPDTIANPAAPSILFIDDDENIRLSDLQAGLPGASIVLRDPELVSDQDVDRADVVVVDFYLEKWIERDQAEPARAPITGLAVASTLRSRIPDSTRRPTAFVLWSSDLTRASGGLPAELRQHVFARANGIEWAFPRDTLASSLGKQILLLAQAVRSLPESWPPRESIDAAENNLWRLLGLDGQHDWTEVARRQVRACRPPLHELSERSHGLMLLRWMLHRILPYPTFLISEPYLCARLRVDELGSGSLRDELDEYRYSGSLAGFTGDRWWRAGIESWLFNLSGGVGDDAEEMLRARGAVARRQYLQPVVTIGRDYDVAGIAEVMECVRIQPDDWPLFADDAWTRITDAAEELALRSLVVDDDEEIVDRFDRTVDQGRAD